MKAIHITPAGKELQAHEVTASVVGFISWRRLGVALHTAGEVSASEEITSYQVDERGLTYRVK